MYISGSLSLFMQSNPLIWDIQKKEETLQLLPFCRDYWTRTSDPYVPNVVRYQLR